MRTMMLTCVNVVNKIKVKNPVVGMDPFLISSSFEFKDPQGCHRSV